MSDARDTSTDVAQFDGQTESGIGGNASDKDSGSSLSIESIWDRRDEAIEQAFSTTDPVLIEALPSTGKSYGLIEWADATGKPLTVFTSRIDLYEQYVDWCEERGLSYCVLPSLFRDCESANGQYGAFFKKYRSKGLFPREIHGKAESRFGTLPCQQNGECSYFVERDLDPKEYDVLIGHYKHAHVAEYVKDRFVAFDEFPNEDFLHEFSAGEVNKAVSNFLKRNPELPFDRAKQIKQYRHYPTQKKSWVEWFDKNKSKLRRDEKAVLSDEGDSAHCHAGAMAYAILASEELDNGWEYTKFPNGRRAVRDPEGESLHLLTPPNLEKAESVIALDGTPTMVQWRLLLGARLQRECLLSQEERQVYVQDVRNLRFIQTTPSTNPYSNPTGKFVTEEQDVTLFERIKSREGRSPALITTKTAFRLYKKEGVENIISKDNHYGNLKGSNEFSNTRLGIVAGSTHYGDPYIEKWAALHGESAERKEGTGGIDVDFGTTGNKILYGFRELEVLQAAMRFGRDGGGATIYVHTAALPEWIPVEKRLSRTAIDRWSSGRKRGMEQILAVLRANQNSSWKSGEVANQVEITRRQVRDHLNKLVEYGYLDRHQEGRGHVWTDVALDQISERGHVDFSDTVE
jgi:predicted transcriptional regulator